MEFLEDLELYDRAMMNAYNLITKRKTLDDIYYALEEDTIFYLNTTLIFLYRLTLWQKMGEVKI